MWKENSDWLCKQCIFVPPPCTIWFTRKVCMWEDLKGEVGFQVLTAFKVAKNQNNEVQLMMVKEYLVAEGKNFQVFKKSR